MNFLWQSNGPWVSTGYGVQTKLMLRELKKLGHDPECFAFYGLQGGVIEYDGYKVWPAGFHDYGSDVVAAHITNSKCKALVSLMDIFPLNPEPYLNLPVPWIAWIPVDHKDLGPETITRLKSVDVPVAMSQFGAKELAAHTDKEVTTIYHAVNTQVFRMYDPDEKKVARESLGLPSDAYIVGMVMANKGYRKLFPLHLQAIKTWADAHPDREVIVYIHADPTDLMDGFNLKKLVERFGLSGKVHGTSQYFTTVIGTDDDFMVSLYNCFDVLMNCSAGEGFGVPIIEAQSCGTPVIAGNYTAMPELVFNGCLVNAQAEMYSMHYGWHFHPSHDEMVDSLESVYRMDSKERRLRGREAMELTFDISVIAAQWDSLLKTVEESDPANVSASLAGISG